MATPKVSIVIKELNAFVEKAMIAFALQVIANLVASPLRGGTPVDTGWARANWVPNIGSPLTTTVGEAPKRRKGGKRRSTAGDPKAAAEAALLTYKLGQGPIYITNNVPYIKLLNEGSSQQAPAGFIQLAVARAAKTVAKRRIK